MDATTAFTLAGLRILMAVVWIVNLEWKLPPDFGRDDPEGLLYSFERAAEHAVIGPLQTLAEDVFIPNFTAFGWIVFLVELAAGLLLLLGLWTRLGALIGLVQALLITLLVVEAPDEWFWGYVMFVAIHLVLLLTPAGQRLALDGRLRR